MTIFCFAGVLALWTAVCLIFGLGAVLIADMAVSLNQKVWRQWRERHHGDEDV